MLAAQNSVFDFTAKTIDGLSVSLGDYRGQVMLIVNVASRCVYTSQYRGLEDLYRRYREEGLVVLGFPCDQFGHQEPGTEAEIRDFCSLTYDVTFPMFSKVTVNGDDTDPLYAYLKTQKKGLLGSEAIKWNFTKFLVDRQGKIVRRFAPADTPETIGREIVPLLVHRT